MVIKKKKTSSLETSSFLKEIFFNNKLIVFCLIILSLITSYILFIFQSPVLSINKNLRAVNFISSTNFIYKRMLISPKEILEEYVSVLKLGVNIEDFHNVIESNKNIEVTFNNFEKFRNNLVTDAKRTFNGDPLYKLYYITKIDIDFRDKLFEFKNRDEMFLENAMIKNKEFIKNLKIIDEIVKFNMLRYIRENNALVNAELLEKSISNNDYFLDYKIDNNKEIRFFKKDEDILITNSTYDQINQKYGFSKKSFIKGVQDFDFEVKNKKFSELFLIILFIYLTGFFLNKIIRFKLT